MFVKFTIVAACLCLAIAQDVGQPIQYPAGVDPATCPNYPFCDIPGAPSTENPVTSSYPSIVYNSGVPSHFQQVEYAPAQPQVVSYNSNIPQHNTPQTIVQDKFPQTQTFYYQGNVPYVSASFKSNPNNYQMTQSNVPNVHFVSGTQVQGQVPNAIYVNSVPSRSSVPEVHYDNFTPVQNKAPTFQYVSNIPAQEVQKVQYVNTAPAQNNVPSVQYVNTVPAPGNSQNIHYISGVPQSNVQYVNGVPQGLVYVNGVPYINGVPQNVGFTSYYPNNAVNAVPQVISQEVQAKLRQEALDRGEYIGDGDYHGEGLEESGAF